ncbi:MAG TPA: T9SS type A sorting domain-containing protein, partial [Saprospiraceae bacterium]|nr:T9SS type A sorting domain-containing protein [Saprospiraceae bacterium]
TWLYSGVMYLTQQYMQDGSVCGFMSLVSSYSIFAACGYNLALSIEVFNSAGQPVDAEYRIETDQVRLQTAGLPAGLYFVKIKGEKSSYAGRMVKI